MTLASWTAALLLALATFCNDVSATVRRPDGLAASRTGDLPESRFANNGKTMTAFAPAKIDFRDASSAFR